MMTRFVCSSCEEHTLHDYESCLSSRHLMTSRYSVSSGGLLLVTATRSVPERRILNWPDLSVSISSMLLFLKNWLFTLRNLSPHQKLVRGWDISDKSMAISD